MKAYFSKLNINLDDDARRVNFYRIIAIITAVLYPLTGHIYKLISPEVVESLLERWILSFLFLILVILSFFNTRIKDRFPYLIYLLFFLLSLHSIYLINLNWHSTNYVYGILFILIAGNIIVKNLSAMISYNVLMYILIVYSLFNAGSTEVEKSLYFFFISLTIMIAAFINYSEIKLWKRLNYRIQEQELAEKKLRYRVELDKMITNLSTYFINLAPDQIPDGIESSIKQVAKFINADKSFLMLSESERKICYGCKEEVAEFFLSDYPSLESIINDFKTIKFSKQEVSQLDKKAKAEAKELLLELNVKEFLLIPVISHQKLIGYLYFGADKKENWTEKIILLLKVVGEIFANGIARKRSADKVAEYTMEMELTNLKLAETSQKLTEKINKAKKLHKQFLTQEFPNIDKLSFAAHYHPAENLGGDFYNAFQTGNKVVTYIVDITGHGLDGAMLNIFVRESINSYLLAHYKKGDKLLPAKIIEFIFERYRKENFPEDYFICIALGILDLDKMEYTFVNNGIQVTPMLIDNSGQLKAIETSGLPISSTLEKELFKHNYLEQKSIDFRVGDTVVMITDGLIEEESNQQIYGEARYKEVLSKLDNNDPTVVINQLNNDFKEFAGSLQGQDDITILAVKREKS